MTGFKRKRKIAILGYNLIGIGIIGFFAFHIMDNSRPLPGWFWIILMFIGGSIVVWKTFEFEKNERLRICILDILYCTFLVVFPFIPLIGGINFLIGISSSTFVLYTIDKQYLNKK